MAKSYVDTLIDREFSTKDEEIGSLKREISLLKDKLKEEKISRELAESIAETSANESAILRSQNKSWNKERHSLMQQVSDSSIYLKETEDRLESLGNDWDLLLGEKEQLEQAVNAYD